ncbi:hypothetical protein GCM10022197_22210 [Microlunatus spumicola]|uniref:Cytochrome b561 domain-containing protein n=1 Tax=Microlunatus spumicola TaxID=81499 RepID=A0ABP6XF53_9ACTN
MSPLDTRARAQLHTVALQLGLLTFVVQLVGVVAVGSKHGPSSVMVHLVAGLLVSTGLIVFGLHASSKSGRKRPRDQRLG